MFYPIFPSPKVQRCAIITYTHGIYELPHKLPHELKFLQKRYVHGRKKMPTKEKKNLGS